MPVTPLAQCASCDSKIPPMMRNVIKSVPSARGVAIFYQCPNCGTQGTLFLGEQEARKRADEIRREEQRELKARWIGREVKGLAVDLEAVETVADLKFFWDDQERYAPWTLVRESA